MGVRILEKLPPHAKLLCTFRFPVIRDANGKVIDQEATMKVTGSGKTITAKGSRRRARRKRN